MNLSHAICVIFFCCFSLASHTVAHEDCIASFSFPSAPCQLTLSVTPVPCNTQNQNTVQIPVNAINPGSCKFDVLVNGAINTIFTGFKKEDQFASARLQLWNISGQIIVDKTTILQNSLMQRIKELSGGIYNLSIITSNNIYRANFIKFS